MIEFRGITKTYHGQAALQSIELKIGSGELFVLVGPSGSGKTTLLKTINRLVVPDAGQVLIDGEDTATVDLQDLRRHTGYVLQSSALFPNMSVMQNAGVQLEALGWPRAKREARIRELLALVDLDADSFANRRPNELSGGEAQRVGIVRALAADPKLILMDEPFSALDPVAKRQLQALILRLHDELSTTFVFVTHDMQEAIHLADRLAVIHDGVVQQVGTPAQILQTPKTPFVADFFKDVHTPKTLQQVLAAGFGQPGLHGIALEATTPIKTWAQLLAENNAQIVHVGERELTLRDMLAYLAQTKEDKALAE